MSDQGKSKNSPVFTRRKFLKTSSASAAALMAFCALPGVSWSVENNILKVRTPFDIATFDPAFGSGPIELMVGSCIFNNLITLEKEKSWVWKLEAAESMKQLDPKRIEFRLMRGIMFTNGYGEMTAEDVKYSFHRIIDPKMKNPYAGDWAMLDHVEVKSKYVGIIHLKQAFAPLWNIGLPGPTGLIYSKKAMETVDGKMTVDPLACSGPYELKEWKPKQVIALKKNKLWKGDKAQFDEIQLFPIASDSTAQAAFESGDIDFTVISASAYQSYGNKAPKNARLLQYDSLFYSWLGINMENPMLTDIRVRKAIQMAVDVNAVVEAAYFGLTKPATGAIPPGLIGHRGKSIIPPEGDIAGAKALLAEAGYPNGIELHLACLNNPGVVAQAQVIQAFLGMAGIRILIDQLDPGTFWVLGSDASLGEKANDVQLYLQRFSTFPDPSFAMQWFTSDQVGVWNWERHRSAEFDKLNKQASEETDPAKRDKMYKRMQDIMELSGCYQFLAYEPIFALCRNTLDPQMRPDGYPAVRYFQKT